MPKYLDLFMRDNFGDDGTQPTPDAYVSGSPDILPYGQGTLSTSWLQNPTNYGPPLVDVPLQNNRINNIYVRSKNNYNGATSGKIYLHYAPANLLVNVSRWRTNVIPNNNGQLYANVSAAAVNQIAAGDQPFNFNPSTSLGSHFCLLARVSTQLNPNPLPASDFTSWQAFVNWVRNNAWVAWHNVNVVNTLPAQGYLSNLAFQNINPSSQFYGFQCNYANMPAGSILRLYALPNPESGFTGFDTGPSMINNVNGSIGQGAQFPASYETTIFTTCQFPGSPITPPPNVSIETVSLGYMPSLSAPENAKYLSHTIAVDALGIDLAEHRLSAGGGFVQITSYNAFFSPSAGRNLLRVTRRG